MEEMQDEKTCSLTFGTSAAESILFRHFTSILPTKLIARLYREHEHATCFAYPWVMLTPFNSRQAE